MSSDAPASTTANSTPPVSGEVTASLQRPALSNVSDLSTLVARSGLQGKLSAIPQTKQSASKLLAETQSLITKLTQTAMSKLSQASATPKSTATTSTATSDRPGAISKKTTSTVSSEQPAAISLTTPPATTMQSLLASAGKAAVNGADKKGKEKKEADEKDVEIETSESSSENSSSESSSSSEGESDGEKKSEANQPGANNMRRKRGRPRKYIGASTPTMKTPSIALSKVISSNTRSANRNKKRPSKVPERLTMSLESQKARKRIIISDPSASPQSSRKRGRGCGDCPGCLRDDCGKCTYCKDKPKFGGPGRKKQRCALRVCSNFVRVSDFLL